MTERLPGTIDWIDARVPDEADLERAAAILRLLADPTRLRILLLLTEGERPVGHIAQELDRPVPGISQHLARLRSEHLVEARREGTTIHYSLPNEHVLALVRHVLRHAEHVLYPHPPHHGGSPRLATDL